ncbi:uncharacterized protein LOC141527800 [Cotesia typhae]|uniref:uncharacterized protein LOC141527800 n=1 Tax=Cotesia typhae TaxID=2053667 RepID=UPI003D684EA7
MDPWKLKPDFRPGSRKPWDLLSEDRKQKIRKLYRNEIDSRFNRNQKSLKSIANVNSPPLLLNNTKNDSTDGMSCNNDLQLTSNSAQFHNISINNDNIIEKIVEDDQFSIPISNEIICLASDENSTNFNYINPSISLNSSDNTINLETDNSHSKNENSKIPQTNSNLKIIKKSIDTNTSNIIPCISETLKISIAKYIVDHKISQVQSNALLNVLRLHPGLQFLPKDSRSLLKSPRNKIKVKKIAPGEYIHLGLEVMLQSLLTRVPSESIPYELIIDFSTDGAELNNEIQLWPIQFRVVNLECNKPELAGIYKGDSKPTSFSDFFSDFVTEINSIISKGGIEYNNKKIKVKLRCFIADAPARAYVLNHYGHNSEYPCSKCYVKGSAYMGSKRFPGINYKSRTDQEYRLLSDVDHNKGKSALHDLPIDLVSQVSFDYMHLVCLGVMKKSIESLVFGKCKPVKLPAFQIKLMSNRLMNLQLYCPREFARNPRALDKLCHFKATEYRQLLLYTFIVVARGLITDDQYNHFLLLHSSMRVLLSSKSSTENVDFSEESLKNYVIDAENIHGLQFLTYNAHGLLHLVSDYKLYGSLDSVSAFTYENRISHCRNFVRKPDQPLQQIFKRIHEELQFPITIKDNTKNFKPFSVHKYGPIPRLFENSCMQYESLQTPSFFFSIQDNDNTVVTEDGRIGLIKNIILYNNTYFFAVHFFEKLESFYTVSNEPSMTFGVFLCSSLNDTKALIITYNEIRSKCYRMPFWVNKPFLDYTVNDEQINNAYVSIVLSSNIDN